MEIITTIYRKSFAELNAEQQAKAIDIMREIESTSGDTFFAESDIDYMKTETLPGYGINDAEIQWSGFWTQGSGASISTDSIDIEKFLRKVKAWSKFKGLRKFITDETITAKVTRNSHHYSHEYTVSGDVEISYYEDVTAKQDSLVGDLQSLITDTIRDLSRDLYRDLEKSYDYTVSDEGLKEQINGNDIHFQVNAEGEVLARDY